MLTVCYQEWAGVATSYPRVCIMETWFLDLADPAAAAAQSDPAAAGLRVAGKGHQPYTLSNLERTLQCCLINSCT
jgi:hypothetical protein